MKRVYTLDRVHGPGNVYFCWQNKSCNYLVTTGYDNCLNIFDRHGEKVDHVNLPGFCTGLSWDSEGDLLGAITDRSPTVVLWDAATHKTSRLDTGIRDVLTLLVWSKQSQLLAVATSKGNLLIYDHESQRKIPVLGKHSKKIIGGAWSDQNNLALIGEDRMLTVSNREGDTMAQSGLKGEPSLPQFVTVKAEGRSTGGQNCVSLVLNKKAIYLLNIHDSEMPHMVHFSEKNGTIIDYAWYGDGLILIAFSSGIYAVISTQTKEVGQEILSFTAHKDELTSTHLCARSKKLASCSDNVIKVFSLENDTESEVEEVLTLDDEKSINSLAWTEEGQMLAVGCSSGSIHVYLAKLAVVGGSFGTRLAFLSSLLEVNVLNAADDPANAITIHIEVEPSIVAVDPFHVAVAMNNRVWFYSVTASEEQYFLMKEKEYVGIVKCLRMNGDYAAALFTDGRLYLHVIESSEAASLQTGDDMEGREVRMFPEGSSDKGNITCMAMTNEFLIFGADNGTVEFFMLEDWAVVNIYRHSIGIKDILADPAGLRLVILDDHGSAFVYNAVTDVLLELPSETFPAAPRYLLWDNSPTDRAVFIACDSKRVYIYATVSESIEGPSVEYVDSMRLPAGQFPLLLYNGLLVSQTQSGKTSSVLLSTHDFGDRMQDRESLRSECLDKILQLRRYDDAFRVCTYLNESEPWQRFGEAVMSDMNVELALRIYRQGLCDPGMVMSLQSIKDIEERCILAGHLAMFLDKYELAQKLFLSSTEPVEALTLAQNVQDWDTALVLARRLAPEQVPNICREYAAQLEWSGDYHGGLEHYERALITSRGRRNSLGGSYNEIDEDEALEERDVRARVHNNLCRGGIARCSIRCGNAKRGVDYALMSKDKELHLECAEILESMKLYSDAALLFETGQNYEKAAHYYLRVKNSSKVDDFLDRINAKQILLEYAKAKEAEHKYRDAVKAYSMAGESEHIQVVRILLEELNNPGEAVKIVKELKSVEGAKMVAQFFQRLNDMSSAIEFLVLSKCTEEAFQLASSTGQMDIYANVLLGIAQDNSIEIPLKSDFNSIALFYEQDKNPLMAGKFYCLSENYRKGVKLLLASAALSSSNESEAIRLVIEAASKSHDEQVMRQVIDYLIGETDGIPKDFKYLFRLYMSLGHYREAAKTAIIIAREEQSAGNYRNSHDLLFGMAQELKKHKIKIPLEMNSSLMLIHSYLLAKIWIKAGDHVKGSQLLIRVSKNISRFPAHTVPILTSTVVECQKGGFKKHSIQFAMALMKAEYRELIDSKFKRKIETLVRKSAGARRVAGTEENEDADTMTNMTDCPYCGKELPETELTCNSCKNTIPFCIATGHHLIREELTFCPKCDFPAIMTHFLRLLEHDPICPMCSKDLEAADLIPSTPDDLSQFFSNDINAN